MLCHVRAERRSRRAVAHASVVCTVYAACLWPLQFFPSLLLQECVSPSPCFTDVQDCFRGFARRLAMILVFQGG